jgi:hypothetical protein
MYGLKMKFDLFLNRLTQSEEADQGSLIDQLGSLAAEFDRIAKESPDVPDKLYDRAKKEQLEDKEGV